MLSQRCGARLLGHSSRPRMVPAGFLRPHIAATLLSRPAPNAQSRRTFLGVPIVEPVAEALMAAHSFTGLPWFLVIPAASVVFSAVTTVPLLPYTRRYANRLSRLQPLFYAWHQKARSLKLKDPVASANREIKRIRKDAGLQQWKPYLRLMLSLPPWIIVSGAMRHISSVDPTFANEGFLWFPDLTVADPLYILPTILVGSMLALMGPRSMAEAWDLIDVHDKSAKTRRSRMVVVAAPFLFNFISTYPSGMLFFWLLTGSTNKAVTKVADKLILPPAEKNPWAAHATTEPWHIDGPK